MQMPPIYQYTELLAWLACFKERTDHLKPEWVAYVRRTIGVDHADRWRKIAGRLADRGCWKLHDDGSITVCKIKEKKPNHNWKMPQKEGQSAPVTKEDSKESSEKGPLERPFSEAEQGPKGDGWMDKAFAKIQPHPNFLPPKTS